ncbi:MAG: hypothetical protein LC734_03365, partial [Acidobacteria bacterium]|nr:hypothetical protein [Acidobacteriota bacterium]
MRNFRQPLIILFVLVLAGGAIASIVPHFEDNDRHLFTFSPAAKTALLETVSVNAADSSNSDAFHFLPPLGSGGGNHRKFDPSLVDHLKVELCEVTSNNCVPVRTFTAHSSPEQIRFVGHHYNVNFNAAGANLSNLATYRIVVDVASLQLGSIDITPGMRSGLGATWPIKFLVEKDPAIRVRVLRFRGQSASQIVNALKSEFNLCGQPAAALLAGDLRPFPQAEIDVAINGVCQDVVIPDTTKVADEESRNALLSYDPSTGRMVFTDSTDLLRRLRRGDVFVSEPSGDAAPFGYLRKITSVRRVSGQIILETVQAKLNEAIYQGTLEAAGELAPSDAPPPAGAIDTPESGSRKKTRSVANIIIDEGDSYNFHRDIDVTVNFAAGEDGVQGTGSVRVQGYVYFNAGYNVGIGIRPCFEIPPACPDRFEAWAGFEAKSRLRVTGDFDGTLNKEKVIYQVPMKPIVFFIGPVPVVLVPEINVKLGLNGEAHVDFVFEGEAKSVMKAGAKWLNPDYGGNGWNNISEFTPFEKRIHEASITARLRVEGYAKADAKIKLYGVVGPGINGSLGILVDADTGRKPFWFMEGHVTTNVTFEVGIADIIELTEYSKPILNEFIRIAESPNSPPVFSNVKTDTIFADIGRPVTLGPRSGFTGYFDVRDPEGDVPILTAHSNVDGNIPLTYTFRTTGLRTITITAQDSEGLTATATLRVDVRNSLPIVTISSASTTIPATVQFFITA